MSAGIVHLASSTFDEHVASSDVPVLVDFWAEWCGPCLRIAPVLEELAAETNGQVSIAKVNVDDHQDLAQRYGVMSIPTLLLFHNGEIVKRIVGAKGKGALLEELDEFLVSAN